MGYVDFKISFFPVYVKFFLVFQKFNCSRQRVNFFALAHRRRDENGSAILLVGGAPPLEG